MFTLAVGGTPNMDALPRVLFYIAMFFTLVSAWIEFEQTPYPVSGYIGLVMVAVAVFYFTTRRQAVKPRS